MRLNRKPIDEKHINYVIVSSDGHCRILRSLSELYEGKMYGGERVFKIGDLMNEDDILEQYELIQKEGRREIYQKLKKEFGEG